MSAPTRAKRGQCRQCGGRFPLLSYSPRSKKSHRNGHLANHSPAYNPTMYRCDGSHCAPGRPDPLVLYSKHPKFLAEDDTSYWVEIGCGSWGCYKAARIHVDSLRLSKAMRLKLYRAIKRAVEETIHPNKPLRACGLTE